MRGSTSRALLALCLVSVVSCGKCKKDKAQPDPIGVPAPPRVTTQQDIGTEIGNGRVLDTPGTEISTSTRGTIAPVATVLRTMSRFAGSTISTSSGSGRACTNRKASVATYATTTPTTIRTGHQERRMSFTPRGARRRG